MISKGITYSVVYRQTGKDDPIAYTIIDKAFGKFDVLNTANGWWIDRGKVEDLINAYKIDCPDEEAIVYAGISIDQLKYFKELHPYFSTVKSACKQFPFLSARKTIVDSLKSDVKSAFDYMERKKKHEWTKRDEHVIIPTEKTLEDLIDEADQEDETNKSGDN